VSASTPGPGLTLEGLTVGDGARPRLRAVTLSFVCGRPTLIVGPNGAGKSTLLRALVGLEAPSSGRVVVDGAPLADMPRRARAAVMAWLPQQAGPDGDLTARELVEAARFRFDEPRAATRAQAERALSELGALALADRPLRTLSGGEAQRARLAALAAQESAWWLLDEPANHLDPVVRFELVEAVCRRAASGLGLLFVTHDLTLLPHVPGADVLVLVGGQAVHCGPLDDPDLPARLGVLLGLDLRAVEIDDQRRFVVLGPAR
jgi:iron complex transport system ATP-binding protein